MTLHVVGRARPITVEIVDISTGGVRLRLLEDGLRVGDRGSLHFLLPGRRDCRAGGRVVRVDRRGEIVIQLEESNAAFGAFVASLATS